MGTSLRTIRVSFDWWELQSADKVLYTPQIGESIIGWWLDPDTSVSARSLNQYDGAYLVHPYNYDGNLGIYGRNLGTVQPVWTPTNNDETTYTITNFTESSSQGAYRYDSNYFNVGANRPVTLVINQLDGLIAGHTYHIFVIGSSQQYAGVTINGSNIPSLPWTVQLGLQQFSSVYAPVVPAALLILENSQQRITGLAASIDVKVAVTPAPYQYPNTPWYTDSEQNKANSYNTRRGSPSWQSPLLQVSDAGDLMAGIYGFGYQCGHADVIVLVERNDALEGLAPIEVTGPSLGVLECDTNSLDKRTVFVRSQSKPDVWQPNKLYPLAQYVQAPPTLVGTGYMQAVRPETNLNTFIPQYVSHARTGLTEPTWPAIGVPVVSGDVCFVGYYTILVYPGNPSASTSYILENGRIWRAFAGARGTSKPDFDANQPVIFDGTVAWYNAGPPYEWQPNVEYGETTPSLSAPGYGYLRIPNEQSEFTIRPGGGAGDLLFSSSIASTAKSAHSGAAMPAGWETYTSYSGFISDGELVYQRTSGGISPATVIGLSKPDSEVTFQMVPADTYYFTVTLVDQQNITDIDPSLVLDDPETGFDLGGVNVDNFYQGQTRLLRYDMNLKRWVLD